MNRWVGRKLGAVGAFLALLVPSQAGAQKQEEWTWTDRAGKTRTQAELEKILAQHKLWAEAGHSRGTRADLSRADLTGANLRGADLTSADLRDAELRDADLNDADLRTASLARADLGTASLTRADLAGADLGEARLAGAFLYRTNLTGADLNGAHLGGANLSRANLTDARLGDAELKDAYFFFADLLGAIFEPKSSPEIRSIAAAYHLEFVTYDQNPDALVQLRKQFQENGFRTQERKITYALSRRKAQLDGPVERWFQRVAFDLTCQYGMNPGRALQIWLALLLFCWLVYAVLIHVPGESGIYRLQRTGGPSAKEEIEEQIRPRTIPSRPLWRHAFRWAYEELRVFFWAGFFSLMSAFNIGFRDINFGRWLRLLPRTEYDLKAKGWARTVAGFQSLISVYLIALWVLTYFGRPFE